MTRSATAFAPLFAAVLAAAIAAAPAHADDVEDALEAALQAYRDGDVDLAREEADFASTLMAQQKAAGLADFLPAPLPGWTREDGETQALGAAMMGGGMMASAEYDDGQGADVGVTMMANNAMVTAMAAMFDNAAAMGAMGTVKRFGRQKAVITRDGEIQTLVDRRIMITVDGSASIEAKEAYFSAIDFAALKKF